MDNPRVFQRIENDIMQYAKRFLIAVVFVGFAQGLGAQDNMLTDTEKEEGWELLFDGESVDAWRGYNLKEFPSHGWKTADGALIVGKSDGSEQGDGGSIITREHFTDFDFTVDFLLSDTANSGIFYMVVDFEDTPIWHNAPEYQLLDDETYYNELGDWMDTHRTGDNYDLEAAPENYSNPVGEWNTARIVKRGNVIEHWLNGNMTLTYEIGSIKWMNQLKKSKFKDYPMYAKSNRGSIGLQDHGHEVRFKNIKIRRL